MHIIHAMHVMYYYTCVAAMAIGTYDFTRGGPA
jgi:hypothetical protein